ncbi:hypothetical protein IMZ48_00440, partial [Candidatus Bathyarchaeota archaeon]|nr:hypothetical protein [Candidatus Bathyarchaeota archaeon]
ASDSENEYDDSSAPLSQKMRSELAKFADQLGFSKVEVQDEPEDVEDASDADAESKAPAPADVKKGATVC